MESIFKYQYHFYFLFFCSFFTVKNQQEIRLQQVHQAQQAGVTLRQKGRLQRGQGISHLEITVHGYQIL